MDNTYLFYLNDVLKNIIERAAEVNSNLDEFNKGVQFGYYEAISHMLNQADVFEIRPNLDQYLQEFDAQDILDGNVKKPFTDNSID